MGVAFPQPMRSRRQPRFTFEWLEKLETTPVDDSRQLTQKLVALYRERLAQILEQ